MCLGTLTHHMHHDVRKPMVIDPDEDLPPVYANPQRTVHHQCEISAPKPGYTLLESHYPLCDYHSCCIPVGTIEFCDYFRQRYLDPDGEYNGDEPDSCLYFILEHRHERLPYLGDPMAYAEAGLKYPATWSRDIEELHRDWSRYLGRDAEEFQYWRKLVEWDEDFYEAAEELHTLALDAEIHYRVYLDMNQLWPAMHPVLLLAEENMERAEGNLAEQQTRVRKMLDWAEESCIEVPPSPSLEDDIKLEDDGEY